MARLRSDPEREQKARFHSTATRRPASPCCGGGCTIPTPAGFGSVDTRTFNDSFTCCFIDEVRSYGVSGRDSAGCPPGYDHAGCSVSRTSGGGSVWLVGEDPGNCTCQVSMHNNGTDGATFTVNVSTIRGCD